MKLKRVRLQFDRYAVFSDTHFGDTDHKALEIFKRYVIDNKIEHIVGLGDIFDFHWFSSFAKSIDAPDITNELLTFKSWIKDFQKRGISVLLKEGNHEKRAKRLSTEFQKILTLPNLFKIYDIDVKCYGDMDIFYRNELLLMHGHEIGSGSGNIKVPASYMLDKVMKSVICAHWHRPSHIKKNIMDGSVIGAWSLGHLQNPNPAYMPHNNWVQGFADVSFGKRSEFQVTQKEIINGRLR